MYEKTSPSSNLAPGLAPCGVPQTFEEYLLRVNPTKEALDNLAAQYDESPIIMLNFLQFNPRGDNTVYSLYAKSATPEIQKVDSYIAYYGQMINDFDPEFGFDTRWDGIAMPVYYRRKAFLQLQNSPVYQRAIAFRTAGTTSRLLYVLGDGDKLFSTDNEISILENTRKAIHAGPEEVYICELLSLDSSSDKKDLTIKKWSGNALALLSKVGAKPILSLVAQVPVVSENLWDVCNFYRFPNTASVKALYRNTQWKNLLKDRSVFLKDSLTVATNALILPG